MDGFLRRKCFLSDIARINININILVIISYILFVVSAQETTVDEVLKRTRHLHHIVIITEISY